MARACINCVDLHTYTHTRTHTNEWEITRSISRDIAPRPVLGSQFPEIINLGCPRSPRLLSGYRTRHRVCLVVSRVYGIIRGLLSDIFGTYNHGLNACALRSPIIYEKMQRRLPAASDKIRIPTHLLEKKKYQIIPSGKKWPVVERKITYSRFNYSRDMFLCFFFISRCKLRPAVRSLYIFIGLAFARAKSYLRHEACSPALQRSVIAQFDVASNGYFQLRVIVHVRKCFAISAQPLSLFSLFSFIYFFLLYM